MNMNKFDLKYKQVSDKFDSTAPSEIIFEETNKELSNIGYKMVLPTRQEYLVWENNFTTDPNNYFSDKTHE